MKFKGVDRKSALGIFFLYIVVDIIIRFVFDMRISLVFVAIGMALSGIIGVRNKTYAILNEAAMDGLDRKMTGFMMYMNYLLIFLGAFLIFDQF